LVTGPIARHLPEHIVIREERVPAQSEREGQARTGAERVFGKQRELLATCLLELAGALREGRGLAEQKVADAVAGDLAREGRGPGLVELGGGIEHNIRRIFAAGVDGVASAGPGQRVV